MHDFLWVFDSSPGKIGDVDETVNSAEVYEHAIIGDVLNRTLENLAFLQLGHKLCFLFLLLRLKQGLVRNHNVPELLIDLHDLEVHRLIDERIVITNRLDVNLGTRQEGLDSKYVYDHATLRASLDKTFDDFVIVVSLVNSLPRFESAGLLMRKDELALLVLCGLDKHLNLVPDLQVRIVTEFRSLDHALALVSYVDDHFPLVD